jgi:hypothetical protein
MIEIVSDENGMRIIVTDGMSAPVGDRLVCPRCGVPAGYIVAWFTENAVRPVRAYQLLACGHEFSTRVFYLHAELRPGNEVAYEIRPCPDDLRYDPTATSIERWIWTTAGTAESSREIFHMYGGD